MTLNLAFPIAIAIASVFVLPANAGPTGSQRKTTAPSSRAQRLVERTIAANPDMLDVIMHVTPLNTAKNVVVAAHLTRALGEASGDDDLKVMRTGTPIVEVQKDGVRIGVLVQLRDATGHAIGAVGLMYPYQAGDDQIAFLKRSQTIRDRMAHVISSRAALFGDRQPSKD